ncbi:MAG: hypothetical protein NVV73_21505 [Cellvibrionaceae bacterium]|nr:hypothetical protein [Cellvibrionaceae bacterium]
MTGLTIEQLNVAYGKRCVLHDLQMEPVGPGKLVALLGANAVGKSTLLKSLAACKRREAKSG